MDSSDMTFILLLLVVCMKSLSGLDVPQPAELEVKSLDAEVIAYWKPPTEAPSNAKYSVQMGKYGGKWDVVKSCTEITAVYCVLSSLIQDSSVYKVRVQLVAGDNSSRWTATKVRPEENVLQPPSYTLMATSSTLSVYIHQKHILRELFPYGLTYTMYLEETRKEKTITAYLRDDMGVDQRTKTFTSLQWGQEYCVSMQVERNGARFSSAVSPKQCLVLPDREWFIIAVCSLSVLGVLVIVAITLIVAMCYLRRPEKTPAALKSAESNWLPLTVEEGTMEVITDKGWFLSSYKTEVKNSAGDPVTHITVTEESGEEKRRTSMDSGVSMESSAATRGRGSPLVGQEDSGCGSLGPQADYPLQEDNLRKREDSGLGLGCQRHSSPLNPVGQDGRLLKECPPGGNYRSQSPPAVRIGGPEGEEALKQIVPDAALAEVVTGYRADPQSCICAGAGQCTWCHKLGRYGPEVIRQYRSLCINTAALSGVADSVDSFKMTHAFSNDSGKSPMDPAGVAADDLQNTLTQLEDTFPLLSTLPSLTLAGGGHDFDANVSLSLRDVQLNE